MKILSAILIFTCFISSLLLIIGFFSPRISLFWLSKTRTRLKSFTIYSLSTIVAALSTFYVNIIGLPFGENLNSKKNVNVIEENLDISLTNNDLDTLFNLSLNSPSLFTFLGRNGFVVDPEHLNTEELTYYWIRPRYTSQDSTSGFIDRVYFNKSGYFDQITTNDSISYFKMQNQMLNNKELNLKKSYDYEKTEKLYNGGGFKFYGKFIDSKTYLYTFAKTGSGDKINFNLQFRKNIFGTE